MCRSVIVDLFDLFVILDFPVFFTFFLLNFFFMEDFLWMRIIK